MCLAVPLKLITVTGNEAVGEAGGLTQRLRVDFIQAPQVGDYVMVHAGFAIERLRPEEAEASRAAWEEVRHAQD